jgi:membrane-associated phospholipid phosphatase
MKTRSALMKIEHTLVILAIVALTGALAHGEDNAPAPVQPVQPLPSATPALLQPGPQLTLTPMNLALDSGDTALPAKGSSSQPASTPAAPKKEKFTFWKPEYKTVSPAEYVGFGALALADGAALAWLPAPTHPNWTAHNWFDDGIRNTLRLSSPSARATADGWSTGIVIGLGTLSAADSIIAFAHKDSKTGVQMLAMDVEAFASILGALEVTKTLAARERPYMRDCPNSSCSNTDRFESFFSGHTSLAFNAAGLICSAHLNLGLWKGEGKSDAADIATCVAALTAASSVGVLRIMSDNHYGIDVLTGAGLGALSGFLIPQAHFGFGHRVDAEGRDQKAVDVRLQPMMSQQVQGVGVTGVF